jgi:alginate O-acetyltransferase complex protein AlgI
MLFNSFPFIFLFLPIVFIIFFYTRKWVSVRASTCILVSASLFFYSYWNPIYVPLLLGSIITNYILGKKLSIQDNISLISRKNILIFGISANLALLCYFKYTDFLIVNTNALLDLSLEPTGIILPLALSFFTFQQIAYLVDCYRDQTADTNIIDYALFVSFFPQLIAGPIVHHKEMMPQFASMKKHINWSSNLSIGTIIFAIGLFKKVVLADNFAIYSSRFFDSIGSSVIHQGDAWFGASAYFFQIYFDFSGYSDMAIGLAYMFGIVLPINFNSPYKSTSIIDFWRRWHMTLSRFLRDYLYISLGGNRKGPSRRYINLALTMLLGGLWHGAAWTFVVWGALHGVFLAINHFWITILQKLGLSKTRENLIYKFLAFIVTTFIVLLCWVYFRSSDLETANRIIMSMMGLGETGYSKSYESFLNRKVINEFISLVFDTKLTVNTLALTVLTGSLALTLTAPNTAQIMRKLKHKMTLDWALTWPWVIACSLMISCSIIGLFGFSEFIYFQF